MQWNENIRSISPPALTVRRRVAEYLDRHPSASIIHLNESRMSMALPAEVERAMKEAVDEVSTRAGLKLDCPWSGYDILKSAVAAYYARLGADIPESDIFITTGMETAYTALSVLFGRENTAVTTDPGNRVIWQVNAAAGRTLRFLKASPENRFLPLPDERPADLIYLSSPHFITGAAYTREELAQWVDHANRTGAVIVFDASLSPYLDDVKYPRSIFEIPGAKGCAAELFSFENSLGVKELKAAYLVIPQALERGGEYLQRLFSLSQEAQFTPPSFVMQKAAERLLSEEARRETDAILKRLKEEAAILSTALSLLGIPHVGDETSPYIWAQCPAGLSSWQTFDLFLEKAQVVVVPGSRFGSGGEGFFRITCFGDPEESRVATERITRALAERGEAAEPPSAPASTLDLFGEPKEE